MIAGMTYYQIAAYFLIYSFLGWCLEVVYHAIKRRKVINRGFLNGPVCPVYGFGVIAVFALTKTVLPDLYAMSEERMSTGSEAGELIILFLMGMILTTLIELIAGWLLDVCFHARWWDYSNVPLNFKGYICLPFSIIWGLAIVFVVKVVQPLMEKGSTFNEPTQAGWIIMAILYVVYVADFIVTVLIVAGMNKKLTELDEIQQKMRIVSNGLSKTLGENTIQTQQKLDETKAQAQQKIDETKAQAQQKMDEARAQAQQKVDEARLQAHLASAEMKERQEEAMEKLRARKAALEQQLLAHKLFGAGRLIRAFPEVVHDQYDSVLDALKEKAAGAKAAVSRKK